MRRFGKDPGARGRLEGFGAVAALSILASGCAAPGPTASFTVDLRRSAEGVVAVSAEFSEPGPSPVVLSSFVQPDVLRIDGIRARAGGRPLVIEASNDAKGFLRWQVSPPEGGGPLEIEYEARPGVVEMAKMSGPSGYRIGYLDSTFGLFGARQIFVLPTEPRLPAKIRVRFEAPPGRQVVTTWSGTGGDGTLALDGHDVSRRLLEGIIGVGRFETARSSSGTFAAHAVAELPESLRQSALRRAVSLGEFLSDRLGPPDPRYNLILVPKSPDGATITVTPATGGFGTSLGPGLPTRWLTIGRAIGQAYLSGWIKDLPESNPERRILEAMPTYFTADFSDRDGWRSKRAWLDLFYTRTADLDLEEWRYPIETVRREWRTVVALDHLSREMTEHGLGSLEELCRRTLGRSHRLPWDRFVNRDLPPDLRTRLQGWLSPNPHAFPPPGRPDQPEARVLPPPPPIPRSARGLQRIDIYMGARTFGLLEQCGCKANQQGGMARRATVLKQRLRGGVQAFALELGDAVPWNQNAPGLDSQKVADSDLALSLLAHAGVRASVVGHAELSYGPEFLAQRVARLPPGFELISANIGVPGLRLSPVLKVRSTRPSVTVAGLLAPESYDLGRSLEFEDAIAPMAISEPAAAAARALRGLKGGGLTVAAGPLGPEPVLEVHKAVPDLTLIATSNYYNFDEQPILAFERPSSYASIGMLDDTLLVLLHSDVYALIRVGLAVDERGRLAGAELEAIPLGESVPDDPIVRRRLNEHYDRLAKEAGLTDRPPIGGLLRRRLDATYVGASACSPCHAAQEAQWKGTSHASAFATLLERNRQGVPGCYACHVTGYRQPGGYHSIADLGLRHIQCEACHGPGSRHVASPEKGSIVRVPAAAVCTECHSSEHSDMNDGNFDTYWARIVHQKAAGEAPRVPAAPGR